MYQTCDIDGLIKVSPHAVFYIFHVFIGLLTTGTKSVPYLSTKALLCVTVYISGLVALEKKQTQSIIAKTIGYVTHDALNRLAENYQCYARRWLQAHSFLSLASTILDT